nr:hypothetical protein [Halioglobus sp. HI00S01]
MTLRWTLSALGLDESKTIPTIAHAALIIFTRRTVFILERRTGNDKEGGDQEQAKPWDQGQQEPTSRPSNIVKTSHEEGDAGGKVNSRPENNGDATPPIHAVGASGKFYKKVKS